MTETVEDQRKSTHARGEGEPASAEHARLAASRRGEADWLRFGPYLSERQWGTVHEDYSASASRASPGPPAPPARRTDERKEPMKAILNGHVIAESDATVVVEGNHYFPLASVDPAVLRPSDATSACPWKGLASYHSIEVGGRVSRDAAWTYRAPKPAAAEITDHVAFSRGVEVTR